MALDKERAPLIKLAFEEYATGNWTVEDLAEHLAACGLTTRATPRVPSAPVTRKTLYQVLANPYYKGVMVYKDVEYVGTHQPLVSGDTWQQVQDVMASHVNGERTREHPHFLKGSLYCRNCGSRMIINYTKSRSGVRYPYFICAGRHTKRVKNCKQKAVLIEAVEEQVQQIYDRYSLPPEIRGSLEKTLQQRIGDEREKYAVELDGLRREKDVLERKRKKLLEAHYSDAIPLDLLKSEQQKIAKQLAAIDSQIAAHKRIFTDVLGHLSNAMELIEDCGKTYRLADDQIKRMMNQTIFSKLWVGADGSVTAEFKPFFASILEPIKDEVAQLNKEKIRSDKALTDFFSVISNRIQKFFAYGWNNAILVRLKGFEPPTFWFVGD